MIGEETFSNFSWTEQLTFRSAGNDWRRKSPDTDTVHPRYMPCTCYAIRTHGLPQRRLQEVARATTLASSLLGLHDHPWQRGWSACGGLGTSRRMPPPLRKWSSLLKSGCLEQSWPTRAMYCTTPFGGKSPPGTTCVLEPTTLSYRGRTPGTF